MAWYEILLAALDILARPSVLIVLVTIYLIKRQKQSLVALGEWFQATIKAIRLPGGWEVETHPLPPQDMKAPEAPVEKKVKGSEDKKIAALNKQLLEFASAWQFEWIWGRIYKSQIEILGMLSREENEGLDWGDAFAHYYETTRVFPALKDYNFNDYMHFLIDKKLITEEPETEKMKAPVLKYKITDHGKRFLLYLEAMKYNKDMRTY